MSVLRKEVTTLNLRLALDDQSGYTDAFAFTEHHLHNLAEQIVTAWVERGDVMTYIDIKVTMEAPGYATPLMKQDER